MPSSKSIQEKKKEIQRLQEENRVLKEVDHYANGLAQEKFHDHEIEDAETVLLEDLDNLGNNAT